MRGSRGFRRGGGGGGPEKNSDSVAFFKTYFTVLQRGSNGLLKENFTFQRFQRGSNIYQGGGGQLFPGVGGSNAYFYINL